MNNHILGVVGISGEPDEVRNLQACALDCSLLTEELNTQQEREKEETKNQFIQHLCMLILLTQKP